MPKFILIVILLALTGCETTRYQFDKWEEVQEDKVNYRVFHVQEMPCIWVAEFKGGSGDAGVSCDWSKYQGEKQ